MSMDLEAREEINKLKMSLLVNQLQMQEIGRWAAQDIGKLEDTVRNLKESNEFLWEEIRTLSRVKKIGDFLIRKKIHGQPAESGTENLEFIDLFASNSH